MEKLILPGLFTARHLTALICAVPSTSLSSSLKTDGTLTELTDVELTELTVLTV